jgi:hypothetical protein
MWRQEPNELKTLNEIRIRGFRVLVENLGPADAVRFIQSYTHGSGDYTKERKTWLEKDFDTVIAGIMELRKGKNPRAHFWLFIIHSW